MRIPEISTALYHKEVLDLSQHDVIGPPMISGSEVVLMTQAGKIIRWNPEEQMVDFLYQVSPEVESIALNQGHYLVLKQKNADIFLIFDLNTMKELALLKDRGIKNVLGVTQGLIVYLNKTDELVFWDFTQDKMLLARKLDKPEEPIYNADFQAGNGFILSHSYLYIFNRTSPRIKAVSLKYPAAGGFLKDKHHLYYGSADRRLVCLSLHSGNVSWKFTIGDVLTSLPRQIGRYIVVIPRDNNIYFFTRGGDLHWWQPLNSASLMPVVPLKENAAAFLWDKTIKFFDYKNKKMTSYPLGYRLKTSAVQIGPYIYVAEGKEDEPPDKLRYLLRIGNNYGVEIKSDPPLVKPVGKSIKFVLNPFNLIKPNLQIKILQLPSTSLMPSSPPELMNQPPTPKIVLEKKFTYEDETSFAWIPSQPGRYRMVVMIDATNKKNLEISEEFDIVDVDSVLREYYYRVQSQCDASIFDPTQQKNF